MTDKPRLIDADKLIKWFAHSPDSDGFLEGSTCVNSFNSLTDAISSGLFDPDPPQQPDIQVGERNWQEDIKFLIELQKELNSQANDCQASPRFWTVGDYKWVECLEDNAERYYVYLPSAGESYEIDSYLLDIKEDEEFEADEQTEFNEIDCEISAIEWIQKYRDEEAYLIPTKKEHFIRENTMFLTKAEAKQHIEMNHYHYTDEAHTYAMTAWRAPKVERLVKILNEFDFQALLQDKGDTP
ncbi:hypothetical protein MMB75_05130 [Paenibacillus sp. P2(2022)]|uniref:hypothetical protein n=1 Tax=Paenibacillus sp. P2(2022) TaxID=2917813 RepID=UPI002404D983|nr:hypothetical protein [Paenibacillus sp. P2(2022)]MDG0053055.1 hypothetical protein [Paenibacillus sp. P2(2022)]